MRRRSGLLRFGFTLIELAIVLAIAGVLFAGLWRLLSGGNQQLKDTAAASQMQQMIGSVKGFLSSTEGQSFLADNPQCGGPCTSNFVANLPMPSAAAGTVACYAPASIPAASMTAAQAESWCNSLPPGYSSATANSYGQSYQIKVRNGTIATPGQAPATYSFMIMTSGGDVASDTSGGRISGQIGNDGGFVYSNVVCNAAFTSYACGAYGSWSMDVTSYGFANAATNSGHIATLSYVAPEQDSTLPWLARQFMTGDTANAPKFNTMTTDFLLGRNAGGTGNMMYLGDDKAAPTVTGTINLQGGTISDTSALTTNSQVLFDATSRPGAYLDTAHGPFIDLRPNCSRTAGGPIAQKADCQNGLQVNGDANVLGQLNAFAFYASSFLYQNSDRRLKTDIKTLNKPLESVMELNPVSFTFKASGMKSMGVIAQELEKVYPDLVTNRPDTGMKSVNYEGLIAPLIGAVQELKRENDNLRKELEAQKAAQRALEEKLEKSGSSKQ